MPLDQQGHQIRTTFDPAETLIPPSVAKCTYQVTRTPGVLLIYDGRSETPAPDSELLRLQQETCDEGYDVLPIRSAGLIGDWPRPGGLATTTAWPILFGMPVTNREEIVEFRNQTWDLGMFSMLLVRNGQPMTSRINGTGVSMKDILDGRFGDLKGAQDLVLQKFKGKDVTFVITVSKHGQDVLTHLTYGLRPSKWVGYDKQMSTIYTQYQNGAPITRLNLTCQITTAYAELFKVDPAFYLRGFISHFVS